jgi:hypothetical protein
MKLTNVRVYNLDQAIMGLHHIFGDYENSDTMHGFLPFNEAEGVAALRTYQKKLVPIEDDMIEELVNIIMWQDENEMCEYCSIGKKDMDLIHSLSPALKYTFLSNILIGMDIIASKDEWKNLKIFNIYPASEIKPYGVPYTITLNYLHLYLMANCPALTPALQSLVDYIKNFPYSKDLIFNK